MKKKKVLIPIIVAVVVAIVCVIVFAGPAEVPSNGGNNITPPNGNDNGNGNSTPVEPPSSSNWVSPGKLFVGNYTPGNTARLEIEVHNGNPTSTEFSVDYRYPDHVEEGYSKPAGVSDWIKVRERFPVIEAYETYTAVVWLHMPSDATSPGDKWEFWIGVIDKSQTGMVITELAVRVLVTMR